MIIIGVDPGSRITGYGIIDSDGCHSTYVAHGHIKAIVGDFTDRLAVIHAALTEVVLQWNPEEGAIEHAFVGNNPQSAIKLGQARGAAVVALKSNGMRITGYAPRTVKQAVTGNGGAEKDVVKRLVMAMLKIEQNLQTDAADGLAIALCHAHSVKSTASPSPVPRRRRKGRGRCLRL